MSLKISIGSKIISGPFGGGNEFLRNLVSYLEERGHYVTNDLNDNDLDIILLTNPLKSSETSTFYNFDVEYYLKFVNPNAVVFQRINECDERKNTKGINKKIVRFNKTVDVNLFVSKWIKNLYQKYDSMIKPTHVIMGGPSKEIFNKKNKDYWDKENKLRIVTHHWSKNYMKGFDYYLALDNLLYESELKNKFEFSYIGNVPENINFKMAKIINPISGVELGNVLRTFDVYITASRNEPSGNHHMEAAQSGLPILYIDSGALKEYCNDFGVEINGIDQIEQALYKIVDEFDYLVSELDKYPFSFENAAIEIENLMIKYSKESESLMKNRNKNSAIFIFLKFYINQIFLIALELVNSLKRKLGKIKKWII